MNLPLNVLVIEDSPMDLRLMVSHLQRHGLAVNCHCVASWDALTAALERHDWDIILSDYSVPGMEFRETLSFIQTQHPDLPVVLISGSVGEEQAVELLKLGTSDFVLKERLARLVPAIERSLREAHQRREKRRADEEIVRLNRLYATLSQINQAIVRVKSCEELAREVTRVAIEFGGFKLAWIGQHNPQTCEVTPLGCAGEPRAFVHNFHHHSDDSARHRCLCGPAIRESRSCVVNDLSAAPEMHDWQAAMKQAGVRAAAVFPIRVRGEVWGAFGVYAGEPDVFQEKEISLLEEAAMDVGYALEHIETETQRRQAEAALRQSEERFTAFMAHLPGATFLKDQAGQILFVNEYLQDLMGLRDWDGKTTPELVAGQLGQQMTEDDRKALAQGPLTVEEVVTDSHGVARTFETVKFPVRVEGQPALLGGVSLDITERKQAEEALRISEERFRTLFGHMAEGVALHETIYDEHGAPANYRLIDVNASYEEILGLKREQVVGRLATEVYGREVAPYLKEFAEVGETGQPSYFETYFEPLKKHFAISVASWGRARWATIFADITERKRTEAALRQSEAEFRAMFELASIGMAQADPITGQFLRVNGKICEIIGYSADEMLRMCVPDVTHPEDRLHDGELFQRVIRGEAPDYRVEKRYVRKDGSFIWVNVNMTVIRDAASQPIRTMAAIEDITERKRTQEALRESEARYRLLADNAEDFVLLNHVDGRRLYVSPSYYRVTGWTPEDFETGNWRERIHPDDLAVVEQARAVNLAGQMTQVEYRWRCKDGSYIWVDTRCKPLAEPDGRVEMMQLWSRDITARKQVEQERMRLVTAMEQTAEAIVMTDDRGAIFYVNPAFEKITGYAAAEVVGQNPRILKSGRHDAEFYRQMWETLLSGEVWHGRLVNKRKDGALYEEDATLSPVRDTAGKIVNFVAVKRDVTAEVALETQLRQAQKMEAIGMLAGGVAHEINNPVFGIRNYAQLIAEELPPESRLGKFAAGIIKETDRVAGIVHNLLAFARVEKQGRRLASLHDVIQSALMLVQTVIRHDQIVLTVEVPKGLPPVECRSQQLEQVLLNLLTNARDAMNEKYTGYHADKIIHVSAGLFEQDGQTWARVTVEDHGLGIPANMCERIFDPFFTTKPAGKGTGLGLSISHSIMQDHGGQLRVETDPGHFTCFHMELPVQPPAGPAGGASQKSVHRGA